MVSGNFFNPFAPLEKYTRQGPAPFSLKSGRVIPGKELTIDNTPCRRDVFKWEQLKPTTRQYIHSLVEAVKLVQLKTCNRTTLTLPDQTCFLPSESDGAICSGETLY